jgi:hypothetical protein
MVNDCEFFVLFYHSLLKQIHLYLKVSHSFFNEKKEFYFQYFLMDL